MQSIEIRNFRQFDASEPPLTVKFNKGVTALVGENDAGKTAIIDAIRLVLLTRDGELPKLQPEDFHIPRSGPQATEITIRCTLSDLTIEEKGAFAEYLSYAAGSTHLHLQWTARRISDLSSTRRWVETEARSGMTGTGPALDSSARQLLASAYLRPLRDAEREMSPGRGSRLSQILTNFPHIKKGSEFVMDDVTSDDFDPTTLSLAALTEYLRFLVNQHSGITGAQHAINEEYLAKLSLAGENLRGRINFAHGGNDAARLRQLLERLELDLQEGDSGPARGRYGLGSNNLLFMACELLLLGKEPEGLPLLVIEEPEAHLHPQRQLRLMEFLTAAASIPKQRNVQVIVTTHSPNLASKVPVENLVLIQSKRAFALAKGETRLSEQDYRFLQRFLDVTKANLFFARGLLIVEGDAEAILLPALARVLSRDLTTHGVSIVNVGGIGLRRYSRIMQRTSPAPQIEIPVACVTDLDVMPDCAPKMLGLVDGPDDSVWTSPRRRWMARRDFGHTKEAAEAALVTRRSDLCQDDHQNVRTFVSNHWTLEYDLAYAGLGEDVYIAARLSESDESICVGKAKRSEVESEARAEYERLVVDTAGDREMLASSVYARFKAGASKAIAAQYLVELVEMKVTASETARGTLEAQLPSYLKEAIDYATSANAASAAPAREHAK